MERLEAAFVPPAEVDLYLYRGKIVKVTDGDTVRVSIDQGFGIQNTGEDGKGVRLRLLGVWAPELSDADPAVKKQARAARDFLKVRLPEGSEVLIRTLLDRTEKFGRYLAVVFVATPEGAWVSVNEELLARGLASTTKAGPATKA